MIIYTFLLGFFSPYNQNIWLQDQDHVIKNYKQLPYNMHYKAQTSKVQ